MKRHAHIYKDSQASHIAFKDFIAGFDYQRSDSGMWYASHDDTHNFFSAAHPDKLRGINWDTMEIAKDVNPLDKAIVISNYMDAGFKNMKGMHIAELPSAQPQGQQAVARSFLRLVVGRITAYLGQSRYLRFFRLLPRNTIKES